MPTINLTWYQLEQLGLAVCNNASCGHPPSSHFTHGKKSCGQCGCKALDRVYILPRRSRPTQAPSKEQGSK